MSALAMTRSPDRFFRSLDLATEAQTEAFGRQIAALLRPGDMVTLGGALGAGKTTLARAIIRTFLPAEDVPSPTFTLVQTYETKALFPIWHVDLYRVKAQSEIRELGLEEVLDRGVLLVEWSDRMGDRLPRERLDIMIEGGGDEEDDTRLVKIVARGPAWVERLQAFRWSAAE